MVWKILQRDNGYPANTHIRTCWRHDGLTWNFGPETPTTADRTLLLRMSSAPQFSESCRLLPDIRPPSVRLSDSIVVLNSWQSFKASKFLASSIIEIFHVILADSVCTYLAFEHSFRCDAHDIVYTAEVDRTSILTKNYPSKLNGTLVFKIVPELARISKLGYAHLNPLIRPAIIPRYGS